MSRRNVDSFSTRLISPPFRLVSHRKHLVGPMSSVILAVRIRELLARLGLARFEIVQGRKIARMMWQMRLKSSGRNLRGWLVYHAGSANRSNNGKQAGKVRNETSEQQQEHNTKGH
ncbi:hypothetical protein HYE67_009294 [Fusarium culmorum]|uniref:Uncharacterized protein n=1 Tax=Fusarium culmorum TaxID=5516 RepID=A0A2T4H7F1_FUSCU|nr:hypothetical protein FCULG_00004017 [Fusarium culmorum]QPC67063.1 hypothetical protein HYE67_009294 [Fusarium culmorum]